MTDKLKIALRLLILVLAGSFLGFSPTAISVTQNAQDVQRAFEDGNYLAAAHSLTALAAELPWWTGLWESAGEAAAQAGDCRMAAEAFQQARDLNVLSEEGQVNLGICSFNNGNPEDAEQIWLKLDANPAALQQLAEYYESTGRIGAAVEVWHDYLTLVAESSTPEEVLHFGLLMAAETPPKSLPYLETSRDDFPEAGSVADAIRGSAGEEPAYQYATAGQALAAVGRWKLAGHAFGSAVQLRPDYAEAWIYWGEALQRIDDPPRDPLDALETGLDLDTESPLANLFLGIYWQRQGNHQTALDYFDQAISIWPENPDLEIEKGKSLAALGELDLALAAYQSAVDLAPDDASYYRQLAEFCVNYTYQLQEVGLPAARKAIQLAPGDPSNQVVMGQILLALDDNENAVRFYQQALALNPSYAPAHFYLGMFYAGQDLVDQAVYHLQQTLALSQNPSQLDQARRLLAGIE